MSGLIIALHLLLGISAPKIGAESLEVIVDVIQVKEIRGEIIACLGKHADSFLQDCDLSSSIKVTGDVAQIRFTDVKPGEYAIAVFQDLNGNEVLDKNMLNLPIEPFGFTNNPRLIFGPPSFRRCTFQLDTVNVQVTVKLRSF